jgi:hypothetical protein
MGVFGGATAADLLILVGRAYGEDLARELADVAKKLPAVFEQFLKDHPVSDAQWNPIVNPTP